MSMPRRLGEHFLAEGRWWMPAGRGSPEQKGSPQSRLQLLGTMGFKTTYVCVCVFVYEICADIHI